MATLTPVAPARQANPIPGQAADVGGDDFANDGKKLLLIEHTNGAGSDVDLTITTTKTVDGEDVADKTITVPAGERHLFGPFPTSVYNDGEGKTSLSYSSATDIEVAVIDLG